MWTVATHPHLSVRITDRLARLEPQGQAKVSQTGGQVGLQQDVLTFYVPVRKHKAHTRITHQN